ncbi:MAG: efflux RND transporter periplasmic adaptor subunit, partial [Raineya sp.]|nr:efflux RND transporter periplasmic adaptor subunit [Raineya sp.]
VLVKVKEGDFEILVMANGELEAENSIKITAPEEALRSAKVYQVKIADLVPEGTYVKKGDYVATLDKVEMAEKLRSMESELTKLRNQYEQIRLDTALMLQHERNEMQNLLFAIREKENALKVNQYETPAQIKVLQNELEKAKKAYEQAKITYKLKQQQAIVKIAETSQLLGQELQKFEDLRKLTESFVVKAPAEGLVIYYRDWNGQKRTIGSYVSSWDATVTTIPDLQSMISRAYVNEIDISKVQVGQSVKVKVDAFPEKVFQGKVVSISNIGEQRPDSQVKVFEVKIKIEGSHPYLKPTMTTSNTIICEKLTNTLYIPLDCLHSESDSLNFVFVKRNGAIIRQEVKIGKSNENEVVILKGLQKNDEVFLSIPENAKNLKLKRL